MASIAVGARVRWRNSDWVVVRSDGEWVEVKPINGTGGPYRITAKTVAVTSEGTTSAGRVSVPTRKDQSGIDRERREAMDIIEALRFGVAPRAALQELTIGFERIQREVESRLPRAVSGTPTVTEVLGAFGTGKSHIMQLISETALKRGFVVLRAEIDGDKVSLAEPLGLIHSLWRDAAIPDTVTSHPLLALIERSIERGHAPPEVVLFERLPRDSAIIDRLRRNYQAVDLCRRQGVLEEHCDDLEGLFTGDPGLPGSVVKKRIEACPEIYGPHLRLYPVVGRRLDGMGLDLMQHLVGVALLAKSAGYAGLVVCLDEFEIEGLQGDSHTKRLVSSLSALLRYLRGEEALTEAPLGVFIASVPEDATGGQMMMEIIRKGVVEPRYGQLQPQRWSSSDERVMLAVVARRYQQAYSLKSLPDVEELLKRVRRHRSRSASGQWIRGFIRASVHELDYLFGPPGA